MLLLIAGIGAGIYCTYTPEPETPQPDPALLEQQRQAQERQRQLQLERQKRRQQAQEQKRLAQQQREEEQRRKAQEQQQREEEQRRKELEQKLLEEERLRKERERLEQEQKLKDAQVEPEPEPEPEKTEETTSYAGTMPLMGSSSELKKEWQALLETMIAKKEVGAFAAATEERIRKDVPSLFPGKNVSNSAYRTSPVLSEAVEFCYLVRHMGVKKMENFLEVKGEEDGKTTPAEFLKWLLTDKTRPLHNLLLNHKLNSGVPNALGYHVETYYSLWKRTKPKDMVKYFNLAQACALVHWRAAQSKSALKDSEEPELTIPEVYDYFREMDFKHKLLTDVKKLSVTDLLLVVNVRLPRSEFEWVQRNMHYKRGEWGKSYEAVPYDMKRATQGRSPYKTYKLEEILKVGGVCADRAYFASNTAKCMGIPACYVSGDGNRGPHAWLVYMANDKEYVTSGSYGYNTGRYGNSCSCRSLHESTLLQRDKKTTEARIETSISMLLFSDLLSELEMFDEALGLARQACIATPYVTACWEGCLEVMKVMAEDEKVGKDDWRKFSADMMRYAAKNTDLLDLAQGVKNDYLLTDAKSNAKKIALRRDSRNIEKFVEDGRIDLAMENLERSAQVYADESDWRGMSTFYAPYYKKYASRGDIFVRILRQHGKFVEKNAGEAVCRKLARDAEKAFSKYLFKGDYFKKKKDVVIVSVIADLYRKGGDSKKADKIEKEAKEVLEESAQKADGRSR